MTCTDSSDADAESSFSADCTGSAGCVVDFAFTHLPPALDIHVGVFPPAHGLNVSCG